MGHLVPGPAPSRHSAPTCCFRDDAFDGVRRAVGASQLGGGRRAHRPPVPRRPLAPDPGGSFQWLSDHGQVASSLRKVPVPMPAAPPGWLEDPTSSHLVPEAPRTR